MKISLSSFLVLMAFLLFHSGHVMALHHEEQTAGGNLAHNEGKVLSFIDTTGYTYMELENGKNKFWIAAPTTKVNKGDHIRFVESMRMTNFTSNTLNRTFSTIVFVSSTQVKK